MQEDVLYFFKRNATPFLDFLFNWTSFLAEQYVILFIFGYIYWNISKKQGIALTFVFLVSVSVNSLLKIIFHTPRPFQVLENFHAQRLQTATGYSFPSGHTQGAATFYLSLAQWLKKPAVWLVAVLIAILVGISRVYLGVHWPVDVIGGWFFGAFFGIWFYNFCLRLMSKPQLFRAFIISYAFFALLALFTIIYINNSGIYSLFYRNFLKITAIIVGSVMGYLIEIRYLAYQIQAKKDKKILRFFCGMLGAFFIIGGLKLLSVEAMWFVFLRYFLLGLWITFIFPWIGSKLKMF